MTNPNLSRARAVLIGNATYRSDSGIPDLPAAAGSVSAMFDLLTGDLCGWPKDRVVPLVDVPAPDQLARKVAGAIKDVQGVVLLYYVGHGLRTPKGQLALALSDSDQDVTLVGHTAMLYENLADILRGCSAATKLVILDCCHAELGNKSNYVFQSANIADTYPVDGLYFMAASKTREKAKTPLGGSLTYFTRSLIDTVTQGIQGRPEFLRIDQIFAELRRRMAGQGLPEPVEAGTRDARRFLFARNAVPVDLQIDDKTQGGQSEPAMIDRSQYNRILTNAERATQSITGLRSKALALASIASGLAVTDLSHADSLIAEAECTAQSISDRKTKNGMLLLVAGTAAWFKFAGTNAPRDFTEQLTGQTAMAVRDYISRDWVLSMVAEAAAAIDPARAGRIAASITNHYHRASALAAVAHALGTADLTYTGQLIADAETAAKSITDQYGKVPTLVRIANAAATGDLARVDPLIAEAERTAHAIIEQTSLLMRIGKAKADAITDPSPAARITDYESWKAQALVDVAQALRATDPARANRLIAEAVRTAQSVNGRDPKVKGSALAGVAGALTATATALTTTDPDRAASLLDEAERIAHSIADLSRKATTLAGVGMALSATDTTRAYQIVAEAERAAQSVIEGFASQKRPKSKALAAVVASLAFTDPERAELVARSIQDEHWKAQALASLAAATDPARAVPLIADAETTARSITEERSRALALAAVAETLAYRQPDSAESIAQSITNSSLMAFTLIRIAAILAAADPDLPTCSAYTWTEPRHHLMGAFNDFQLWKLLRSSPVGQGAVEEAGPVLHPPEAGLHQRGLDVSYERFAIS